MSTVSAIVVHKAEEWTPTVGSLLLLFKDFGMKIWLRPEQILNYNAINHLDNHHFQQFQKFWLQFPYFSEFVSLMNPNS